MSATPEDSWVWLTERLIHAVHEEQLAEHGGAPGVRDAELLASALARPRQRAHYGTPDVSELAASYAFGIARNHPFVDGNKRSAFVALEVFLALNGYELVAGDEACVITMLSLAAGELTEDALVTWIRAHAQPR